MKMLRILFVACAIIVNIATTENIDFKCNNNSDDFLYTMPHDHCASYYRCQSHQMIKFDCPLGMIFDFYMQKCVSSSNVCYESTCQGKLDGLFADTTQACRRFFRCLGGKIVSYDNCRQGLLFNGKTCDYADRVNCEAPKLTSKRNCQSLTTTTSDECKFLSDGVHAAENSKDCKSYIKCFNGKSTKHRCPSSSVFSPNEQTCVPDTLYDCPKSAKLERLCKGRADGFYIDPRFGCKFFLKCSQGFPVQFDECPKGQVFDIHRKVCAYKSSTTCSYEAFSHECKNLEMGFYQNRTLDSSCKKFFYCYNGGKTSLSCPLGEIFNGEICVNEKLYNCPNQESDSCDTKENGYYKDFNLDCRSYFYCSSNRKYSFICQDGQAFDGHKCVSKRRHSACIKLPDCLNKPDGYYQDMESGCTKYFYCKQGDKIQNLRCDNGRLYNGHSCVSPSSYACPSVVGYHQALKLNCIARKCHSTCSRDGFFADYDSKCQNYYFCVSGKQTKLSCNSGYVFNENDGICVPLERYQCPVYCSSECS